MAKSPEPVVLELATLPREQVGPFLILGLPKDADKDLIEKHWADRVKLARRDQLKVPLEDVNWARDVLGDVERRLKADAGSLNADTADGCLAQLAERYGANGAKRGALWQPLDCEKALADYVPPAEVPDPNGIRAGLTAPEIPQEVPAAFVLLEQLCLAPCDPWNLVLPAQDSAS
jgi:hypothetical protein